MVNIQFEQPLQESIFKERPNRFLIRCEIISDEGKSELVDAHLPDSGRLKELLIDGRKVWLKYENKVGRKTKWTAVLVETPDRKGLVSINSTVPNRLVEIALQQNEIEELKEWTFSRREYTYKGSRWDFLLENKTKRLALEVKGVTLIKGEIGYFPDAVTVRGARHVQELTEISQEDQWDSAILFIVQREDVQVIRPCEEIDPNFSQRLKEAKKAGVKILGRKCHITIEGIELGDSVPVEID